MPGNLHPFHGPWHVGPHYKTDIESAQGRVAEVCPQHTPQGAANARLIAAAPDLLSIAKRWAALDGGSWHVERHAKEKGELLKDTAAAIAKAESNG